jgi:hypothetical protein
VLGLTALAGEMLAEARTGKNGRHALVGLFRQSVFGRLAGYDDVNDAERLRHDPAMRWIVGGKAAHGRAIADPPPRGGCARGGCDVIYATWARCGHYRAFESVSKIRLEIEEARSLASAAERYVCLQQRDLTLGERNVFLPASLASVTNFCATGSAIG